MGAGTEHPSGRGSAGSHLALRLAGDFDSGDPTSSDAVERSSSRPDFMAVLCPWASGDASSPFQFSSDTPPIYQCHAEDDTRSPIALARAIQQQLQALGTLVEVYASGGHDAFFVSDADAPGRDWPDAYLSWLQTHQLIPEPISARRMRP